MSRLPAIAAFAVAVALATAASIGAQVNPRAHWRTIRTEHFYVHFTPETEAVARRAAVNAESAYAALSKHLHPPRGPIDLVVSDDVDYSNGYATPFPSNRIVAFVNPPVSGGALRFTDDPTELVVTHELAHVFHLDRVGGIWKPLQAVLGRSPFLFPNAFQPSWLVEGLAVYYESLITGSGRIVGSEHHMIARSSAIAHSVPRLDQLSRVQGNFPFGSSVYVYGSLFVDYLAQQHGDSSIRTFVESSGRQIIPFWLNPPAKRAFGKRFTTEYRAWSQSLVASAPPDVPPMPGWRDLTVDGVFANDPRWLDDSTLVYIGTPGRESFGAFTLRLQTPRTENGSAVAPSVVDGGRVPNVERQKLSRRNSPSPTSRLPDGSLLYSQLEFTSPINLRSDLYVDHPRGGTQRLTYGARLFEPDARKDGLIVAVQSLPGATRLVLVSSDGRRIVPLTQGSLDEHWSEPRWSPDGRHLVAVRWSRGGTSSVVVVDSAGRVEQTLISERALNVTPSWSPDGRYVYFSSDRDGIANLYQAAFRPAFPDTLMVPDVQRVSDASTGLFSPQRSPAGRWLAATVFRADGYHIGITPFDSVLGQNAPAVTGVAPRTPPPAASDTSTAVEYAAGRMLWPTSWMPIVTGSLTENAVRIGGLIGGDDVVGRHSYHAALLIPTDQTGITGAVNYRYGRFVNPLVDFTSSLEWENIGCIMSGTSCVGTLRRRIRDADLALTWQRVRVRTYTQLTAAGGLELRDYTSFPKPLLPSLPALYSQIHTFPRVTLSAGWSNTQRPIMAISPEDGVSLSTTARYRWRTSDQGSFTGSYVGAANAYKSLDLPGFAHHVFALRAAGGTQDNRGRDYYEVGGVSGGVVDLFLGYTLGEGRRTFGVRGFPAASLVGMRAFAGSAEYRAPLRLPGRGLGTVPMFLDRMSLTLFGDAGSAWCPGVFGTRPAPSPSLCTASAVRNSPGFAYSTPRMLASVGGEFSVGAAVLSWDEPYAYRIGFAAPVLGTELVPDKVKPKAYFAVGVPF